MARVTKERRKQQIIATLWGWLFVLPIMLGLVILNIIPIFQTIRQTFYRVGTFGRGNTFVGLDHYRLLLEDASAWQALRNTLVYTIAEVPLTVALGFIFAVILNRNIHGRGFFRTVFFLPMVVAPAAIAMVWRFLYNNNFGIINHVLTSIGLPTVGWITDPNLVLFSMVLIGIWSTFGYCMVLFLSGMQVIPRDYYEAAEIDGASFIRQQFLVTIPLVSHITFFVLVMRIIGALQVFDSIFMVLDRLSPVLHRAQSLVFLFYRHTFIEQNRGYGAVIVLLLLLLVIIVTAIQQFAQKFWVHYEN